ncbi:MAG: hypothetical protein MMC33_006568 [Icmadophila ericetorum]|nr:hypothetical protein [Icmadophila ericetorum]
MGPPSFASLIRKGTSFFNPESAPQPSSFSKAPEGTLFPSVDPSTDGEDCLQDCASCTIHYPAKFGIDEEEKLYGRVKGWATHMLVATAKTDWVRDVEDEKGSVMEAVRDCGAKPSNGRLMLSASNMPIPSQHSSDSLPPKDQPTTVLLLPAFTIIENVTPASVSTLITHYINSAPTNTTPLFSFAANGTTPTPPESSTPSIPQSLEPPIPPPEAFTTRPSPHKALLLLCSQRTRDARCGQSAPLLRREFERHLRPLGLYRDLSDERPGGVGIYFISHVGGHKFSANLMVYRSRELVEGDEKVKGLYSVRENGAAAKEEGPSGEEEKGASNMGEAAQCIWLARIRPEDCEGIVKFTVLQGKVVKPERQLRGGFDRGRGVVSW